MEKKMEEKILGSDFTILTKNEYYTKIDYGSRDGKSIVTMYDVFPGIKIFLNDFNTDSCFQQIDKQEIIEINHCKRGRFECEFKGSKFLYMRKGDMAISSMNHLPISSSFPTRVYYGISILIEPKITRNNPVLKMFSMDFDEIYSRFCLSDCCHIYRENEQIDHIFDEMYQCVPYVKIEYFRFKVLELFYFIKTMSITYQTDETYYAKEQVDKVKHIRNQLVSHTERRIKLNDLVSAHDISMTVFKSCFKSIYGETPYAYVKKYKMSQAANMLVEESININEIALALSYKNASKFSEAFQSVMGLSPKEYRVKNRVVKRK